MDQIQPGSRLKFRKLEMRKEKLGLVVGVKETGEFISLDSLGEYTLRLLMDGLSVGETETALSAQGHEANVRSFVSSIKDLGFAEISDSTNGGNADWDVRSENELGAHRLPFLLILIAWIIFISYAVSRIVYNPTIMYSAIGSLWKLNFVVFYLLIYAIFFLDGMIHESFHYLTAKIFGVPAKIGLSVRLFEPVLQTDLHSLWGVNKKKRYIVLLSGLMWDSFALSLFILARSYFQLSPIINTILSGFIFLNIMVIISEFFFFTRTDVYFVVETALDCSNLRGDSMNYQKFAWRNIFRKFQGSNQKPPLSNPLKDLSSREESIVRTYSWFMILSSAIVIVFGYLISFWGVVGILIGTFQQLIMGILIRNSFDLIIGAAGSGIFLFNIAFPIYFYLKQWKRTKSLVN